MENVVSIYRIKNEEQWIEQSIKSILPLSDKVVIFDDHSTDKTEEICKSFDKVIWLPSPFDDTLDEVRDKNYLIAKALELCKPLWVFCIDGDEELEPGGAEKLRPFIDKMIMAKQSPEMVHFKFLYMWDDPNMVRHDGLYAKFISPRLWKVGYEPSKYVFKHSNRNGFHCGWVPPIIKGTIPYMSKIHILHWGNFTADIRRRKFVWYNLTDPNNKIEDRYRHIVGAGRGYEYADAEIKLVPLSEFISNAN